MHGSLAGNLVTALSKIPSPIMLDLDGDGVETVSLNNGTYFDHAADGFAEQTGWVGKDDGLLVRDLNGNGVIDSGRELFGSETLLADGSKLALKVSTSSSLSSPMPLSEIRNSLSVSSPVTRSV
jgi:hypothetical protein